MNEQDFERIGQLFAQLEERIDARFDDMESRFNAKVETFKSEIISEFDHALGIKFERLSHDVKLFSEGLAHVTEKVDEVHRLSEGINARVEDLSLHHLAHQLDPKAHNRPGGDRVKEDEAGFGHLDPFHQFDPEFRRSLVEAGKSLNAAAEEVLAYCAEKGIELPRGNTEAMIRLIQESRRDRAEQ